MTEQCLKAGCEEAGTVLIRAHPFTMIFGPDRSEGLFCEWHAWQAVQIGGERVDQPSKPTRVTHAMFDMETGILPCCELHRYQVWQQDLVSFDPLTQPVTCDGTKRYAGKANGRAT